MTEFTARTTFMVEIGRCGKNLQIGGEVEKSGLSVNPNRPQKCPVE